jgi:hypothetical protein
MLRQRARVKRGDLCQRYFIIYLHKFCYTDSISYDLYNFAGRLRSAEDQRRAAQHPFGSGEVPSGHETEFTEDPSRHETEFTEDPPKVPRRQCTRKSH